MLTLQAALPISAETTSPDDSAAANLAAAEQALIDLTNADRISNGLGPLEIDADALGVARERAESQLGVDPLSHDDAKGALVFLRLFDQTSITYDIAGENLARAWLEPGVFQRVEQALMESPLHRKNILEPRFKRLAVGAATDSTGEITFAELYRD